MEFPIIVLIPFYAMEKWMPKDINKAVKAIRENRSIRHAADLSTVP
jgi:hypothetical protein